MSRKIEEIARILDLLTESGRTIEEPVIPTESIRSITPEAPQATPNGTPIATQSTPNVPQRTRRRRSRTSRLPLKDLEQPLEYLLVPLRYLLQPLAGVQLVDEVPLLVPQGLLVQPQEQPEVPRNLP